jgi:hypothetical protein
MALPMRPSPINPTRIVFLRVFRARIASGGEGSKAFFLGTKNQRTFVSLACSEEEFRAISMCFGIFARFLWWLGRRTI